MVYFLDREPCEKAQGPRGDGRQEKRSILSFTGIGERIGMSFLWGVFFFPMCFSS